MGWAGLEFEGVQQFGLWVLIRDSFCVPMPEKPRIDSGESALQIVIGR